MSRPSTSGDASKEVTDEQYDAAFKNAIAVEGITEKLAEVTSLAEELDQALRSAQQDSTAPSSVTIPILVTPSISGNAVRSGDALSTSTEVGNVFKRIVNVLTAFGKRVLLYSCKTLLYKKYEGERK